MPELPEVETVVRDLRAEEIVGRTIECASVYWPRTIATHSVRQFCATLKGAQIESISRRGKFIVCSLSGGWTLLVHLRMTGQLSYDDMTVPRDKHQHVVLRLDDGRDLRYKDTRKFGRWYLLENADTKLSVLGPEPLDSRFMAASLKDILSSHARMLKPLLLDQHVIAGLGNIYADEALWDACLHPCRLSNSVTPLEVTRLHRAIRKVLRRGIRCMGTTLGRGPSNFYSVAGRRGRNQDGLMVFRRTGDPCARCKSVIVRIVVAQRSSHICPECQKES
jgi:formamidopyrimidine-DNA glycosylase